MYLVVAVYIPKGIAINIDTKKARKARTSEYPSCTFSSWRTLFPLINEYPKSSLSKFKMEIKYCSYKGLFKPNSAFTVSAISVVSPSTPYLAAATLMLYHQVVGLSLKNLYYLILRLQL